jgi:hypothetical protein
MASGLIAAALSGFGKALSTTGEMEAKKQNELDVRKQLLNMESERRLREDEITRGRAFDYQKKEVAEIEPLRTTAKVAEATALLPTKVAEKTAVGTAETGVLVNRENATREGVVATEKAKGEVANTLRVKLEKDIADISLDKDKRKASQEALALIDLGNDKKYLSAVQKITDAKSSSADKTQAAAAIYKMQNEKALGDLRTELSNLPDTPENADKRATIRQKLSDLKDSKVGSYADVASLANSYLVASNTILRNGTGTEEELAEAKRLRDLGERLGSSVIEKKIPDANKPKPKAEGATYKAGDTRTIASGPNQGKTAVYDGTGWKLK